MSVAIEPQDLTVEDILNTFEDLSESQKQKIAFIAEERVKEEGLGFDNAYRYICRLVESFETSYTARYGISLDAPIKKDKEDTFYELLGRTDSQLEELFEEPEVEKEFLSGEQVFSVLEGRMNARKIEFLRGLNGDNGKSLFNFSSEEELVASIPDIQAKLRRVEHSRYVRNGKLVPRPIRKIQFTGTEALIDFNHRSWKDVEPIAYFREHRDFYEGLSRTGLRNFDPALEDALRRRNQIEEAIPEASPRGRHLSPEEREEVINAYSVYQGNASEAARNLGWSKVTILKEWRKVGLRAQGGYGPISSEAIEKILEAHKLGMSTRKAAEYAKVPKATVQRHWQKRGLKPHYKPGSKKVSDQELKKTYWAHEDNAAEASKALALACSTVYYHWNRMGLDFIKKIKQAYKLGMTVTEATVYANVDENKLRQYWQQFGLKSYYGYGWRNEVSISSERAETLRELHSLGLAVQEIVEFPEFRDEKPAMISKYLRKLNLKPRYTAENKYGFSDGYWHMKFKEPSQCKCFDLETQGSP